MIHLFGIRHHGPGSARSVLSALTSLQPDIILLEGPVEAEAILPFAANPAMKPPVAVLVYGSVAEEAEPRQHSKQHHAITSLFISLFKLKG